MRIVCWAKGLFYTIQAFNGFWVSGHDYREISNTAEKQTLLCDTCRHVSIAYHPV